MLYRTALMTFGVLAVCRSNAQQAVFVEQTRTHLPEGIAGQCMDAASGDADGDGDLDLALAMEFRPNLLLLNDGRGGFSLREGSLPVTRHDSEDVTFADFDGDGDLDLIFVSEDDRVDELYLNDGAGRYDDASDRLPWRDVSNALAVVDLNGDGFPDLLTGNVGINRALINNGDGRFADRTDSLWPQGMDSRTQDIEITDVDGDGDADVVVGNEGQNRLFVKSNGRLEDATERALPLRSDETREIRAADVDGDGDADLLVANVQFTMSEPALDYVLLNDGSGVFSLSPLPFPERSRNNFTIQVADVDYDGDLDALIPDTRFPVSQGDFLVLLNDSNGAFAPADSDAVLPEGLDGNTFDFEIADFNDDGAADIFLCNRASSPARASATGGLQRLLIFEGRR